MTNDVNGSRDKRTTILVPIFDQRLERLFWLELKPAKLVGVVRDIVSHDSQSFLPHELRWIRGRVSQIEKTPIDQELNLALERDGIACKFSPFFGSEWIARKRL